jgi:aminoglycoside phosphotransferase (APT) family kinase protein
VDLRHPEAEVHIDIGLAEALLRSQHPDLLTAPPSLVGEGWDNVTYRVGSDHAMRIPRRRVAVDLLLNEQRWLPLLASWLSVPVPWPVATGVPSELFHWPWSVVRWIPGRTADHEPLERDQAAYLARELRSLHRAAPPEAPTNPFRGVPLAHRRDVVEERLERLSLGDLRVLWRQAMDAPMAADTVWLHGDLHPRNVVVRNGALAGLLDWGDMTAGDAATDLACAWMLFDAAGRTSFLEAYGATESQRVRAMGWAVNFGAALLDSAEPRHVGMGEAIVRNLEMV